MNMDKELFKSNVCKGLIAISGIEMGLRLGLTIPQISSSLDIPESVVRSCAMRLIEGSCSKESSLIKEDSEDIFVEEMEP